MTRNDDNNTKDRLLRDYDTVLKESAILTRVGGMVFGFLQNISVRGTNQLIFQEKVILILALFSITIAASLFVMPVIYHHLQFPYSDLDKFKRRAHRFIVIGLVPTFFTLYLGIVLALFPLIDKLGYFIGILPFALVYVFYRMRK